MLNFEINELMLILHCIVLNQFSEDQLDIFKTIKVRDVLFIRIVYLNLSVFDMLHIITYKSRSLYFALSCLSQTYAKCLYYFACISSEGFSTKVKSLPQGFIHLLNLFEWEHTQLLYLIFFYLCLGLLFCSSF